MHYHRFKNVFWKAAALALSGALVLALAACGSNDDDSASDGSTLSEEAQEAADDAADENSDADTGTDANDTEPVSDTGSYFDTVITITLYGSDKQEYIDGCFALAEHYENLLSNTVEGSDIWNINEAAGEAVEVDDDTIYLLEKGLYYSELSEGRFDITIGQVADLWHFSDNDGEVPDDADIEEAVSTVDYTAVSIEGNTVTLTNPDAKIDLGGIAKGFIADKMKEYLTGEGIESGIINLGGNVIVLGVKPDGSDYNVGIQKPFDTLNSSIAGITVSDCSVVSSGVYERYFEVDDTLYHHILDTETGYPVESDIYGVTIVSESSVDGDGLSTTCFTLGIEDGIELIESIENTEVIYITSDYELYYSSGIDDEIALTMMQ